MDPDPTSLNLQEPERLDRFSIIGSKVPYWVETNRYFHLL